MAPVADFTQFGTLMERFQQSLQALRQLSHVAAVGRSGGSLDKIADLAESFLDTPQMEQCIARFRAFPGGAEMMDERYQPVHPDLEELARMAPAGSPKSLSTQHLACLPAVAFVSGSHHPQWPQPISPQSIRTHRSI